MNPLRPDKPFRQTGPPAACASTIQLISDCRALDKSNVRTRRLNPVCAMLALGSAERRKTIGAAFFPQRFSRLAHDSPWAFCRRRFKARLRSALTVRPKTAKGKEASFSSHRPGGRIFFEHPPCLRLSAYFGSDPTSARLSRSVDGLGRSERAKRATGTGAIRSIPRRIRRSLFSLCFPLALRPALTLSHSFLGGAGRKNRRRTILDPWRSRFAFV